MQFASTFPAMPAQTLALSRYDVACRAFAKSRRRVDGDHRPGRGRAGLCPAGEEPAARDRCREIRIRAERRLGELMAAQPAIRGSREGVARGREKEYRVRKRPIRRPPTLARPASTRTSPTAPAPGRGAGGEVRRLLGQAARGNRRVLLDPDFEAEAEAPRDIEIGRDGASRWPAPIVGGRE